MKTLRLLGILCVSWAAFALPAAAETIGQTTPATSTMCEEAGLADATPGLQGLCVAMCEAQACIAEINAEGKIEFGPNCESSAPRLLANYDKLKGPADPDMPCVKAACPCWTQAELETIGPDTPNCNDSYLADWGNLYLTTNVADRAVWEYATVTPTACYSASADFTPSTSREAYGLSGPQADTCMETLKQRCGIPLTVQ